MRLRLEWVGLALFTWGLIALGSAVIASAASVQVGKARLGTAVDGQAALLVPVSYPIEMAGRAVKAWVTVETPGDDGSRRFRLHTRASAGGVRTPERRDRFTFVHSLLLSTEETREIRRSGLYPTVEVVARARLDVDRDERPELASFDRQVSVAFPAAKRGRLCATVPLLRTRKRIGVELPLCTQPVRWRVTEPPEHGAAAIKDGRLIYQPANRFRGTDSVGLSGGNSVQIKVGTAGGAVVRALGDSVTAGFGYYDNGNPMPFSNLLSCKPGEIFYNDACSSNSPTRSNEGKTVTYAPDYGLANNVSWAAQWANEHGITGYQNLAVSGSEPSDWLPGGQLYATAKQVYGEDPDYLLMTVGANPLLSEMLFGIDNMGCAVESDITGGYRECIEAAFAGVHLRQNLKALYAELVANTKATIFLMQYHLSVPASALAYSATQIAMMGALLNEAIAAVAAEVSPQRLQVVAPPHFDVGIDISPVFPSEFSCSRFGYSVDGPSVQSDPSQDELEIDHPLSFCSGPPEGPPWVISGDTGIHPSAAGYAQMASRLPAPG